MTPFLSNEKRSQEKNKFKKNSYKYQHDNISKPKRDSRKTNKYGHNMNNNIDDIDIGIGIDVKTSNIKTNDSNINNNRIENNNNNNNNSSNNNNYNNVSNKKNDLSMQLLKSNTKSLDTDSVTSRMFQRLNDFDANIMTAHLPSSRSPVTIESVNVNTHTTKTGSRLNRGLDRLDELDQLDSIDKDKTINMSMSIYVNNNNNNGMNKYEPDSILRPSNLFSHLNNNNIDGNGGGGGGVKDRKNKTGVKDNTRLNDRILKAIASNNDSLSLIMPRTESTLRISKFS